MAVSVFAKTIAAEGMRVFGNILTAIFLYAAVSVFTKTIAARVVCVFLKTYLPLFLS